MENHPGRQNRVAYSFLAGTFDLRQWCPGLWFEGDEGRAIAVQLDGNWERIFNGIGRLGTVLASVRSGPIYAADAWWKSDFESIPGTTSFFDVNSGTEVRGSALGSVTAVIEQLSNQQIASLQFCDRQGNGSLKVMMTNGSNLQAFEDLVVSNAILQMAPQNPEKSPHLLRVLPEKEAVRALWHGLQHSTPGRWFPGLAGITRVAALQVAGNDYAWKLSLPMVHQVMEMMTRNQSNLAGRVNAGGTSMPLRLGLTHWKDCHCGQTFFSSSSQLTIRRGNAPWEAWAVKLAEDRYELEVYDETGTFAASFALYGRPSVDEGRVWKDCLEAER